MSSNLPPFSALLCSFHIASLPYFYTLLLSNIRFCLCSFLSLSKFSVQLPSAVLGEGCFSSFLFTYLLPHLFLVWLILWPVKNSPTMSKGLTKIGTMGKLPGNWKVDTRKPLKLTGAGCMSLTGEPWWTEPLLVS
jgi:hypothetical protein